MNWETQYRRLVQLAREMPAYPDSVRDDQHLVSGCEAKVWLYVNTDNPDAVVVRFDSGSRIVKGLLALIQQQLDGASVATLRDFDIEALLAKEGLTHHLSPSRTNGLRNVASAISASAIS